MATVVWSEKGSEKEFVILVAYFNPLIPDMKMHILLTALHIFLVDLVLKIFLNIKTSCPW